MFAQEGTISTFSFVNPLWFLVVPVLAIIIFYYNRKKVNLKYPMVAKFKQVESYYISKLRHVIITCRLCALLCLIIALARPQSGSVHNKRRTQGLDIMLVLDTSGSMKAMDFTIKGKRYDRLQIIKKVVADFIHDRIDDRIGLVVFGSQAYAQAPLTLDHDVLLHYLSGIEIGMAGEATAIGDATALAINRMKDIKSKAKVLILLTDGSNTAGKIDPIRAAEAAKTLGVKIYTIGVGSNDLVPIETPFGYQKVKVDLDEKVLKKIANITNGKYFRATDTSSLVEIYKTINNLEKSEVEIDVYHNYEEKFSIFVFGALLFLFLEYSFAMTRFRRIP